MLKKMDTDVAANRQGETPVEDLNFDHSNKSSDFLLFSQG